MVVRSYRPPLPPLNYTLGRVRFRAKGYGFVTSERISTGQTIAIRDDPMPTNSTSVFALYVWPYVSFETFAGRLKAKTRRHISAKHINRYRRHPPFTGARVFFRALGNCPRRRRWWCRVADGRTPDSVVIGLICVNGLAARPAPFVSAASRGCQQKHARLTRPDSYIRRRGARPYCARVSPPTYVRYYCAFPRWNACPAPSVEKNDRLSEFDLGGGTHCRDLYFMRDFSAGNNDPSAASLPSSHPPSPAENEYRQYGVLISNAPVYVPKIHRHEPVCRRRVPG